MESTTRIAKHRAIVAFVEKAIVPIVGDCIDSGGNRIAGAFGTGTLFRFYERSFLVSAGHLFDDYERYSSCIGIPVGQLNASIFTFDQCVLSRPEAEVDRQKYDIAIIELSKLISTQIEKNYTFLTLQSVGKVRATNWYLSGFPHTYSRLLTERNQVVGKPFRLMSYPKSVRPDAVIDYDPAVHILMESSNIHYADGVTPTGIASPAELHGISGCSIWSYEDDDAPIWTAEKCLQVIAIQTGVSDNGWIKGTRWAYVANAFKSIDPEISRSLQERMK